MFGFNSQGPISLDAISQYIGSYATPEAAEMDTRSNAPQGLDFLKQKYQGITGDAFADPFADASTARAKAMTEAAMNGASVATGSNTGMKLLSLPNAPAPTTAVTTPGVSPAAPSGSPLLSVLGNRQVAQDSLLHMLQGQGNQYRMASNELQIPHPTAANFLDVLEKRSAVAGATDEFRKIQRENPDALRPVGGGDPRFARTAAGKAIGHGNLHPLAMDETFQELSRQDPQKANALYYAITNRDYSTDIEAKRTSLVEQRDARKKIIEGIKGLEADPVTGDLYKIIETKDFDGLIKQQKVPVTPLDTAAIEAEGGAKRIYGVDLPGMGGLKKMPGTTPEEHSQYTSRTQEILKQHPDMKVADASQLAHRQLYAEQQQKKEPAKPSTLVSNLMKTGRAASDSLIGQANLVPKLMNFLLTKGAYTGAEHPGGYANSQAPIPLIPHPNWNDPGMDVSLTDILKQSRAAYSNY